MPNPPDRERLHREADRRWDRLSKEHPELAPAIAAGRGLVALFIDRLPPAPPLDLSPEDAGEKLRAGIPLLADMALDFAPGALRHFLDGLCTWAAARPDHAGDGARLIHAVAGDSLAADDLFALALAEEDAALANRARQLGVDPALLRALGRFLVSAALMSAARPLAPLLASEGAAWEGATCPACGGPPLLAERQGTEGARVLRCATCGTGWRFAGGRCPGCGADDPGARHYLAEEGREEKYRVDLCDRCHGYVTSCTAFAPTPPELLAIEDAALLHLAGAARERGYHPVGGTT